ncbi:MAG: type IV secretion system DNA-binding domain-containing protein [Armatimonadota bacterium]
MSNSQAGIPKSFRWAGGTVSRKYGDEHYLVIGASGSGKSTLINQAMHSIISDSGVRAVVYDPKQELIPFLAGLRIDSDAVPLDSLKILNPFDVRCSAWDMASDIDSSIAARQLATILVPDSEKGGASEGFFTSAVRDILSGVVLAFIECVPNKRTWEFRDVLLAMLYEPYLNLILQLFETRSGVPFPILQRLRDNYLGELTDPRTKANIRASINSKLSIYEPVAAGWYHAMQPGGRGKLSLKSWINEKPGPGSPGSILVLGNDESARAAIDPINQAIFKRITELVLARPERSPQERAAGDNQIWFFLDEIREAGRLDGLSRLLTKGRSKNACVVMGFQDIDGLKDVYGEEVANELCSQFNNVAVLRVNSPATAQWASDLFGRRMERGKNDSLGFSTGENASLTSTRGSTDMERPFFYTDSFLFGSNASASKSVRGIRKGPDIESKGLSLEEVQERSMFVEKEEAPRVDLKIIASRYQRATGAKEEIASLFVSECIQSAPSDQLLPPWTQDDLDRLGFDVNLADIFKDQQQAAALGAPDKLTGISAGEHLRELLKLKKRGKE